MQTSKVVTESVVECSEVESVRCSASGTHASIVIREVGVGVYLVYMDVYIHLLTSSPPPLLPSS